MDRKIVIGRQDGGTVLLHFLYNGLGLSHGEIKRLKFSDGIKIDGKSVTVRHTLAVGEVLTLCPPQKSSENIPLCDIPLDIVYEDGDILAVNKPSGLAVHPSAGNREQTLAGAVMNYYKNTSFVFRAALRNIPQALWSWPKTPTPPFAFAGHLKRERSKRHISGFAKRLPARRGGR